MKMNRTASGFSRRLRVAALCVSLVAPGVCWTGCSCARYDTFYEYGSVSFIDTGVGGPNQLQFVPEQGTDTIYLRFHSPDVINVRELTVEDTRKHPVLGQYVRDDGSLLIGMFYFAPSGQLDFMKIDGGDPGEVQVSASANGPFVDLPMTVQTMRKTFGPPKSIAYAEVNR